VSTRVAAWALAVVGIALTVAFSALDFMNDHRFAPPVVGTIVVLAFLTVGLLIALRRPRNPIGWIYLVAMTFIWVGGDGNLAAQYAVYALSTHPGALPAVGWVLWVGKVLVVISFPTLVFFSLLLFPDGRLPSKRWRPVAIAAAVVPALVAIQTALLPEDLQSPAGVVVNPVRFTAADPLFALLSIPTVVLAIGVLLACVVSPFVRFRRASGVERQQLKWFATGAAWIPLVGISGVIVAFVAPDVAAVIRQSQWPLSVAGIPIAAGVAILRYRLYDIDVLIRRTLIYAAVSVTLAATYFAGVLLFQTALRPLIGGTEVPVALSTLAVVALFAPLRRRIQQVVDRRFYRSRYDAGRVLDAFSAQLRDEVDLAAVRGDLVRAVHRTVEPEHVSVWLRG